MGEQRNRPRPWRPPQQSAHRQCVFFSLVFFDVGAFLTLPRANAGSEHSFIENSRILAQPSLRGPDDRDGLEDRWKPSIQRDQEQAIPIRELNATARPPLQHNQLMSERHVLRRKSVL